MPNEKIFLTKVQLFEGEAKKYFYENNFGYLASKSDKLVISFAGLEGRPAFQFYGTLRDLGYNALFLKDINKNWYNRGVSCFGNDIEDTLVILRHLTSFFDKKNIFFIGGSMGGYGALLYSSLLGFGNVLAFSPQVVLKRLWSWCPEKKEDLIYSDISKLDYKNSNLTVISSELPLDVFALSKISRVSCNTGDFFTTNHQHNIAKILKQKNVLNTFLKNWIESNTISFLQLSQELLFDEKTNLTLETLLDASYNASWENALQPTNELTLLNKDWHYLDYYSARIYFYTHDFQSSFYHIERGIKKSPDYVSFYGLKASIYAINGMFDEVFNMYDTNIYLLQYENFNKIDFYLHIATLLTKVGKRRAAINIRIFLSTLLRDKNNKKRTNLYQLGRLYFNIGSIKNARNTFTKIIEEDISDWMHKQILEVYLPEIENIIKSNKSKKTDNE